MVDLTFTTEKGVSVHIQDSKASWALDAAREVVQKFGAPLVFQDPFAVPADQLDEDGESSPDTD